MERIISTVGQTSSKPLFVIQRRRKAGRNDVMARAAGDAWNESDSRMIRNERIVECENSAIGKHFIEAHSDISLLKDSHFLLLRKCHRNFEYLIYEMLLIKELNPNLNTQSDYICKNLFCLTQTFIICICFSLTTYCLYLVFMAFIVDSHFD